jgi:hypothetical protein
MPRQRDPLSTEYDDFSESFLMICAEDSPAWHTATVTSPPGDPVDPRGLSAHERAVTRSLYYVLNSTGAEGPLGGRWVKNDEWSFQVGGWSEPRYRGGVLGRLLRTSRRRRVLTARLVDGASAHAHVRDEVPAASQYTANPAEQAQALGL